VFRIILLHEHKTPQHAGTGKMCLHISLVFIHTNPYTNTIMLRGVMIIAFVPSTQHFYYCDAYLASQIRRLGL